MIDSGEIAGDLEHGDVNGGEVNGDALRLPFPDATFDRIIASEVLEHLSGDEQAIAELVRVLRPGGRIAVTVPTRFPERICWALNYRYHDTPGGHVRIYRQHELETKLERSGLTLRGSHHAHALHSPYWWLKCTFGIENTEALAGPQVPRLPRVPDRTAAEVGRRSRPHAEPRPRQEPDRVHREGGWMTESH